MGEVYRARDTRLNRTVAIKVLPQHLSTNPQVRERFDREAKAISSLSHPHICSLYDVGHQDGIDFLVMEYLEGETLAHRLIKGALPPNQMLQYAIQITEALDAAHRHGVIHRDLKPGNIMLTKMGAKLLDFGLAKVRAVETAAGATAMITQTTPLTSEGSILGTLQYMAPEQLEGKEADARTDLFALGAVIYEMSTGRRAFEGKGQASLISAIMTSQPAPITSLQPLSPPALDHVTNACLAKDPEARWQTAHDVLVELKWIADAGSQAVPVGRAPARRASRTTPALALLAGVSLIAACALSFIHFREKPPDLHPVRFLIQTPPYINPGAPDIPILSPDGRRLVFPGTSGDGKNLLFFHSLDSTTSQPIAGTEDGRPPFWSPDSRFIGFYSQGKLKKIDPAGGPVQILADASSESFGGTWNQDGTILFLHGPNLVRVAANGGDPKVVRELDRSRHEFAQDFPHFLPDGRHFLLTIASSDAGKTGTYVASLDSPEVRQLIPETGMVGVDPLGFLIFGRQDTIFAQPFDLRQLRTTGEPLSVATQVSAMRFVPGLVFSLSQNGLLTYRGAASVDVQLAWYNRDGKRLGLVGPPGSYGITVLSPDERRLALERFDPQVRTNDLWILDLATSIFSRVTFNPADDTDPVWSPDGTTLVFSSNRRPSSNNLYRKVVGGGEEEPLLESDEQKYSKLWMKDGRSILFINERGRTFYQLPLAGDRKPVVLSKSEFDRDNPHISPDGHWIAYNSLESGRWEVYIAAFPSFTEKRQVSSNGGCQPLWRKDGKELFYRTLDGKVMAVEVKGGNTVQTAPQFLFQTAGAVNPVQGEYSVTGDGKRFLLQDPAGQGVAPITVVLNWTAGAKR